MGSIDKDKQTFDIMLQMYFKQQEIFIQSLNILSFVCIGWLAFFGAMLSGYQNKGGIWHFLIIFASAMSVLVVLLASLNSVRLWRLLKEQERTIKKYLKKLDIDIVSAFFDYMNFEKTKISTYAPLITCLVIFATAFVGFLIFTIVLAFS